MPMLNWMGREKAAKATKDVVLKILREEKSLGYRVGGSRSCATGTAEDAQERVPPKGAAGDLADARERVPPKGAAGGSRSCATEYRKLVVYGEWNKQGEERLKEEKIEFRQTPYDVVTRR